MINKNWAEDFLWYSYFGITKTDAAHDKEKAAYYCADRAYRDLCRRIIYKHSSSEIERNKKKDKEYYKAYLDKKRCFRTAVCNYIIDSIKNIKGDYESFHRRTCRGIILLSDGTDNEQTDYKFLFKPDEKQKTGLNYGLAQKWLNMTIKNMLVMGFWNDLFNDYLSSIHVPLDSYIFAAAGGKKDEPICKGENVKHLGINEKKYFNNYTWSKIPDDNDFIEKYYQYQSKIKEQTNDNQFMWEHEAWIAQSKNNRK